MEGDSIHIAFGCLDVIEKPARLGGSADDYSLSMHNESDYENTCFKSNSEQLISQSAHLRREPLQVISEEIDQVMSN